jgi:5-methylcytosine-specific restriction endonuclease McrA
MLRHGVLGTGRPDIEDISEYKKFRMIPMVFGLMPESAIRGRSYDLKIIPIIKYHLEELSIDYDEELLHVIKNLCDQYFHTSLNGGHYTRRKYKVSDVRATRYMFDKIISRQNNRCTVCGSLFSSENIETLDHIIPWRLIGDVLDGSNWQFLCVKCNNSKSSNLSYTQMSEFLNWTYLSADSDGGITNRTRYAVLCRDQKCKFPGCDKNPKNSSLDVIKLTKKSAYLFEFLETRCQEHLKNNNSKIEVNQLHQIQTL